MPARSNLRAALGDEAHEDGEHWQFRSSIDRRFWHTSGGWPAAIGFGVIDDFGVIVKTEARPHGL